MFWLRKVGLGLLALVLLPVAARAQVSLAGVVKDASGAVLPGVTVEAASSALIEKTRTAITDGTGQYQIVDLRPGAYTVTFTLAGFSAVKRDGVELAGAGVVTINADMKVGNVTETIDVTGETPVVDVQSTQAAGGHRQQHDQRPAGRARLRRHPGGDPVDAGRAGKLIGRRRSCRSSPRTAVRPTKAPCSSTASTSGRRSTAAACRATPTTWPNAQEMQLTISGNLGEAETGGPILNIVPKTGGNTFKGSIFGSGSGSSLQSNNIDAGAPGTGDYRRRRSSRCGTTAARWAGRSSATSCGSSETIATSATMRRCRAATRTSSPAIRVTGTTRPI